MIEWPISLSLAHGEITLPAFLPDATQAVVRSVDSLDLEECGIQALVMNTFHLMQRPGSSTIQALGGLHSMSGWRAPIFTDSGGFQAYSLIHQNPRFGTLSERGITFQPEGKARKFQLSPEKSIQLQLAYGADVVICLDDCTHVDASRQEQEESVGWTIDWARRSRKEFDRLLTQPRKNRAQKPLLFAVVQGGGYADLRKTCADALLEIGFDGFGFGGWPLDGEGNLIEEIFALTRRLIPAHFPLHALGVGHPYNVQVCYNLGYGLFDSAMPTRDARHGRLYTFINPGDAPAGGLGANRDWLRYVYIQDESSVRASSPLSPYCDCLCCRRYSRGYLHHLFKLNDALFLRLATLHNLAFMSQLMRRLRISPG